MKIHSFLRLLFPPLLGMLLPLSTLSAQDQGTPGLILQIKFEPGRSQQWVRAFETHIAPAIQAAIGKGDVITDFAYFENVVTGQPYDFFLIVQSHSFDFFDVRRSPPHYEALFERVGLEQGRKILAEMASWERSVSITLVRSFRWKQ